MVTPVTPDGEPDLKSLRRLVDSCIESGAVGIGAFGGVSEYTKISEYDREAMLEAIVDQTAGRVPVFVGPTAMSMKTTRANVQQAVKLGGDMLMVCSPPMASMKQDALYDFYRAVADASDLPIMVQDTGASKSSYSAEFTAKLYHEIDTVFSGKIEGPNFLLQIVNLKDLVDEDFQIIGGGGGKYMMQMLRLGVTAIVAGTYYLDIYSRVIQTYLAGNVEKAEELYHNTVLPYVQVQALGKKTMVKYDLKRRGIFDHDDPLFPDDNPRLDPYYKQEMNRMLERVERYLAEHEEPLISQTSAS